MSEAETASSGACASIDEGKIEQLLSEKLMQGYVLLESSCPVCATPLVKNHHEVPKNFPTEHETPTQQPVMLSSNSFDKPFKPVDGVPICVVCRSHVITSESEISILERCDSLKDKGSILLALNSSSTEGSDTDAASKYTEVSGLVVISVESRERDGEDNVVEVIPSPKEGNASKPIFIGDNYEAEDEWAPMSSDEERNVEKETPKASFDDTTVQETSVIQSKTDVDQIMQEYSVRREIATKVLGAKMLQGYVLKETTCDRCGMPLMEHKGTVNCVVCPALAKKAKKKFRAQQKEQEEKARIQRETEANNTLERRMREEELEADRKEKEERLRQFREEELERERHAKRRKQMEEEKTRLMKMEKEEEARLLALEEEEARLQKDAQERAVEATYREEEARLQNIVRQHEENERLDATQVGTEEFLAAPFADGERNSQAAHRDEEEARLQSFVKQQQDTEHLAATQLETEAMLSAQHAAETTEEKIAAEALFEENEKEKQNNLHIERAALFAEKLATEKAKQKEVERVLLEETRRLEALETQTLATQSEYMKRDLLRQQHNERLKHKAYLDDEVARLEEARLNEEIEIRRLTEEQRAEEESKMISALEADAVAKALAAEDAIRKAKDALEAVSTTKREIIAQTIALAEKEAVAETEREVKAELEDYKEKLILQTESQLYRERWETLRMEGRAIMTRRVLQGWELLPETCQGAECEMSPLITKHGRRECVVCAGTGTGQDGVYAIDEYEEEEENVDVATIDPDLLPENIAVVQSKSLDGEYLDLENDFEQKRDLVSKEIGKRMLMGWSLLDASCPNCVMPLLMDNLGNRDICVLCGPIEPCFDASTIKTRDMDCNIDHAELMESEIEAEEKKEEDNPVAPPSMCFEQTPTLAPPPPSATKENDLISIKERVGVQKTDAVPLAPPSTWPEMTPNLAPHPSVAPKDIDLLVSIKERASAQKTDAVHSDPPAHTKGISKSMYSLADSDDSEDRRQNSKQSKSIPQKVEPEELKTVDSEEVNDEPITLIIPKNFDFSDSDALKDLIQASTRSEEPDDEEKEEEEIHDTIEVTKSGAIYTAKDAMSTDMIAKMFLKSPHGCDFQDIGSDMCLEEIKELIDIFMVTNFNEPVPDDFKYEIARDILEKLRPEVDYVVEPPILFDPETPTSAVINLEHLGSPWSQEEHSNSNKSFHFYNYAEPRMLKSSKRSKPKPETLIVPMSRPLSAKSPKPPRAGGNSRREGAPVIVGGPLPGGNSARHYNYRHDGRSVGGMSRAESVATEALESLYIRIDQCKAKLMDPKHSIEEQLATADLMEKLAKAAVAMKAMETLEQNE